MCDKFLGQRSALMRFLYYSRYITLCNVRTWCFSMHLPSILLYGLPLITLVQSIPNNSTKCPTDGLPSDSVFSREKRAIISADFQKTYDVLLSPDSGSVQFAISFSIAIFQTIGYFFFGKYTYSKSNLFQI